MNGLNAGSKDGTNNSIQGDILPITRCFSLPMKCFLFMEESKTVRVHATIKCSRHPAIQHSL
jgi:hypothetical protein